MQPGWCQPVRQEFMENECEALPGVVYPGVRDNRSTINTKTGFDDDMMYNAVTFFFPFSLSVQRTAHQTNSAIHFLLPDSDGSVLGFYSRG